MKIIPAFAILFALFSCTNPPTINGSYSATYTLRSEIANPQNPEQTAFFLNVEQNVFYTFDEEDFSKTTSQKFVSAEKVGDFEIDLTQEEFAKGIDNKITVNGEYSISGNKLNFVAETVTLADGTKMGFDEYYSQNSYIGEPIYYEEFEIKNGELSISGIKYKSVQNE